MKPTPPLLFPIPVKYRLYFSPSCVLRIPDLNEVERQQLQAAMMARQQMFAAINGDLGRMNIVQHQINRGDHPSIKQRVRRYPAAHREEERKLVEDMLEIGIIQESSSAWSSPTVLVKKKDGTTQFCIDYQRLNQVTKVDAYPLPHIEDSLNTLGGAGFFCSLDRLLASGNGCRGTGENRICHTMRTL